MSMANPSNYIEFIISLSGGVAGRRRRKCRMLEETFEPGMTVSLVARRHGIVSNQLVQLAWACSARRADGGRSWRRYSILSTTGPVEYY